MRRWQRNGWLGVVLVGALALLVACDPGPDEVGQELLAELPEGATQEEAFQHLGPGPFEGVEDTDFVPRGGYRSSRHVLGGEQWMVLYYEEGPEGREEVTRMTHTPVVFRGDDLDGWGWDHREQVGADHDVTFPGVDEEDLEEAQ